MYWLWPLIWSTHITVIELTLIFTAVGGTNLQSPPVATPISLFFSVIEENLGDCFVVSFPLFLYFRGEDLRPH